MFPTCRPVSPSSRSMVGRTAEKLYHGRYPRRMAPDIRRRMLPLPRTKIATSPTDYIPLDVLPLEEDLGYYALIVPHLRHDGVRNYIRAGLEDRYAEAVELRRV